MGYIRSHFSSLSLSLLSFNESLKSFFFSAAPRVYISFVYTALIFDGNKRKLNFSEIFYFFHYFNYISSLKKIKMHHMKRSSRAPTTPSVSRFDFSDAKTELRTRLRFQNKKPLCLQYNLSASQRTKKVMERMKRRNCGK